MDKLYNSKSRLGWMSLCPVFVTSMLILLIAQFLFVYVQVMAILEEYSVDKYVICHLRLLFKTNICISFSIIVIFSLILLATVIMDKKRQTKVIKDLTNSINKLSIVSMLKEDNNSAHRECV